MIRSDRVIIRGSFVVGAKSQNQKLILKYFRTFWTYQIESQAQPALPDWNQVESGKVSVSRGKPFLSGPAFLHLTKMALPDSKAFPDFSQVKPTAPDSQFQNVPKYFRIHSNWIGKAGVGAKGINSKETILSFTRAAPCQQNNIFRAGQIPEIIKLNRLDHEKGPLVGGW